VVLHKDNESTHSNPPPITITKYTPFSTQNKRKKRKEKKDPANLQQGTLFTLLILAVKNFTPNEGFWLTCH